MTSIEKFISPRKEKFVPVECGRYVRGDSELSLEHRIKFKNAYRKRMSNPEIRARWLKKVKAAARKRAGKRHTENASRAHRHVAGGR